MQVCHHLRKFSELKKVFISLYKVKTTKPMNTKTRPSSLKKLVMWYKVEKSEYAVTPLKLNEMPKTN